MKTALGAGALLLVTLVSGCLTDGAQDDSATGPATDLQAALEDRDVWQSPQTTPHPAWGWPTITSPGLNGTLMEKLLPIEPRALPESITGMEHLTHVDLGGAPGPGIALLGPYAYVPSYNQNYPGHVVDISDPEQPEVLGEFNETGRDADTIVYPDGRIVVVFAHGGGARVWDATDPLNVELLVEIETTTGGHNIGMVPGTPILYNANSDGGGENARFPGMGTGITEIYDLTDPAKPIHVMDWQNGYGCHDISFYIDPADEKYRAYCAGIQFVQIWDIDEPLKPEVISNIPMPHGVSGLPATSAGLVHWAHLAMVNHDASVLIVGDETGGGALPACDVYTDAAPRTLSGPLGNLFFFDLSNERDPVFQSMLSPNYHWTVNPPEPALPSDPTSPFAVIGVLGSCTAHFGRIIEDTGFLAMAFYGAGVALIDFYDPANPRIVEQFADNTDVWDVWYYQGYLFTGDLARGMDVLTLI